MHVSFKAAQKTAGVSVQIMSKKNLLPLFSVRHAFIYFFVVSFLAGLKWVGLGWTNET